MAKFSQELLIFTLDRIEEGNVILKKYKYSEQTLN